LAQTRDWLRPLFLNRNYGQSTAMQAGFDAARGAVLITLDADLQNDPADIPRLLEVLEARPEIDILSGWRRDRQDRALSRKLPSRLANRLISAAYRKDNRPIRRNRAPLSLNSNASTATIAMDGGHLPWNFTGLSRLRVFSHRKFRPLRLAGTSGPKPGVSPALRPCMKIGAVPSAWFLQAR
jgi:glycosyltransferase involved in cell wall biosynthesis